MNSMTGYGFCEKQTSSFSVQIEIKSYNHRYLDIQFDCPKVMGYLESQFRDIFNEKLSRGHIDVYMHFILINGKDQVFINSHLLDQIIAPVWQYCQEKNIPFSLSLKDLKSFEGVYGQLRKIDQSWNPIIIECFQNALDQVLLTRAEEGEGMQQEIKKQMDIFAYHLSALNDLIPCVKDNVNEKLKDIQTKCENLGDRDNSLLSQQEAMTQLLLKSDINEELVRLQFHLDSLGKLVSVEGPIGKQMEFILQELHREANTLNAKSFMGTIQEQGVALKQCIERIREIGRNIE